MPRAISNHCQLRRLLYQYHDPANATLWQKGQPCEHGHSSNVSMDIGAGHGGNKTVVYGVTDDGFDTLGNLFIKHKIANDWTTCRYIELPVSTAVLGQDKELLTLLANRGPAQLAAPSRPPRQSQRSVKRQYDLPPMRRDLLTLIVKGFHGFRLRWIQVPNGDVLLVYRNKVLERDYGIIQWDAACDKGRFELAGLRQFMRVQRRIATRPLKFWNISDEDVDVEVDDGIVQRNERFIIRVDLGF